MTNHSGPSLTNDVTYAEDQPAEPSPTTEIPPLPLSASVPSHFKQTDLGNAERLMYYYGANLKWCEPWRKWLIWDDSRWQTETSQQVRLLAKNAIRQIYLEAAQTEDSVESRKLAKWALTSESAAHLGAMISLAQMEASVSPDALDTNPWHLNAKNGTIDLQSGQLLPHCKENLISKLVPYPYDPQADCPKWEAFLESIFAGDRKLIDWLWRAIGYSLTGITSEQSFFLLWGVGANGKSTFLDILLALTGEYGEQAAFQTFLRDNRTTIRNDLAKLVGCRFVSALEMDQGKRLSEALVKSLTGGDSITVRHLYGGFFTYRPEYKIWLATNHKPEIRDSGDGIWRRVHLIPFQVTIPAVQQDKCLSTQLKAELPGILAWAVQGCLAWQKHGLVPPETVRAATATYREEQDLMGNFLSDCCLLQPELTSSAADLYDRYKVWAAANGERPLTQKTFGGCMTARGLQREKSTTTKRFVWHGIGLRS